VLVIQATPGARPVRIAPDARRVRIGQRAAMETRDRLSPEALRSDVIRRVRPLCPTMADPEFDALVERIVRTELKFRGSAYQLPTRAD
jgi:hypothetical protein